MGNVRVNAVLFMEIIIAAVTLVWMLSFIAAVIDPGYDGSQYNNIFMVVVGSGVFASAVNRHTTTGGKSNDDSQ